MRFKSMDIGVAFFLNLIYLMLGILTGKSIFWMLLGINILIFIITFLVVVLKSKNEISSNDNLILYYIYSEDEKELTNLLKGASFESMEYLLGETINEITDEETLDRRIKLFKNLMSNEERKQLKKDLIKRIVNK